MAKPAGTFTPGSWAAAISPDAAAMALLPWRTRATMPTRLRFISRNAACSAAAIAVATVPVLPVGVPILLTAVGAAVALKGNYLSVAAPDSRAAT